MRTIPISSKYGHVQAIHNPWYELFLYGQYQWASKDIDQRAGVCGFETGYRAIKDQYPFFIEAFVLSPDHLHCVWTLPDGDADYAKRWNHIKRLTSQQTRDLISYPETASRHKRGVGFVATAFLGAPDT